MNRFEHILQMCGVNAILRVVAAVWLLAMCSGCEKFLEPKSQSEFSPTTIEQLNDLIISAIPEPNDQSNSTLTGGFLDILTDDIVTRTVIPPTSHYDDQWYNQSYVAAVYAMYTWQPNYSTYMSARSYNSFDKIYIDIYHKLVYVNSTLDYADQVSGTEAEKNYVKAQALTLRAFYHFQLVNVYGVPYNVNPDGQGIPLRTTGARENRKMVRNTVGEVYNQVVRDLRDAIGLFEELGTMEQYRQVKPTLPMAMLLLSRAYLYMENWEQAEFYANELITKWPRFQMKDLNALVAGGITNLSPQIAVRDTSVNERRKQLFYSDFVKYANTDVIWTYGASMDAFGLIGKDLQQTSTNSKSRLFNNNTYAMLTMASDDLIASYDPNDLRLRTYFVRSLFDEPNYESSSFNPLQGFVYRAYGKVEIDNGVGIPDAEYRFLPVQNSQTFGYALRITEAYLILAEAQAMQDKDSEALQTLEMIWEKRISGGKAAIPASYKNGDAVELVRLERRRELCLESLRWFDLRRWGMPKITHVWYDTDPRGSRQVFELSEGDSGYTLPIPHTIIAKNPDLSQIEPRAYGGNERPASN